jgi:hypothetical protein
VGSTLLTEDLTRTTLVWKAERNVGKQMRVFSFFFSFLAFFFCFIRELNPYTPLMSISHIHPSTHPSGHPSPRPVVKAAAFFYFFPCNHIINIKKKISFSGEAKDSVVFSFFFCFIRELNPYF